MRHPDPQDEPTPEQLAEWAARGLYMPSRAEIEAAKIEIRKGWGPVEESRRRAPERPVDMGLVHQIGEGE